MTPDRYQKITTVLKRRQPDLTLITDEVHKGRNLSALIRTCDAVGIDTIHTVVPKAGYRHYCGTALGSQKWVNINTYSSVTTAIKQLKQQQHTVIAAHLTSTAMDYREIDYTQPTAIVLGTEKQGVSHEALALVDTCITIPMQGMVESLNVSVATGMILAEAQYQRLQAGLYEYQRLSDASYQQRLFRWGYPALAAFCDAKGITYPALNAQGDIVDGPRWHAMLKANNYNAKNTPL